MDASKTEKANYAKNIRFPIGMGRFFAGNLAIRPARHWDGKRDLAIILKISVSPKECDDFCRNLGQSWGPLGPPWGSLGGLLGRHGAILGASWAVLDASKTGKANYVKNVRFPIGMGRFFAET